MVYSVVYITTSDIEEARRIAKTLVEKRLVACANIVPEIESLYWWEGKINREKEALIFVKTVREKVKNVIEEVKKLHSYEIPAIVSFDVSEGNKNFLDWISEEVVGKEG
ncbi:MAG: divalent-cation tolerance protein CutA [Actinomycetota bacterium]|nr:divalent-cation tolerance protein CutA [Actinomycetota bacterium]